MGITTNPELVATAPSAPLVQAAVIPPGKLWWKALIPVAVAVLIALTPPPEGLTQHA